MLLTVFSCNVIRAHAAGLKASKRNNENSLEILRGLDSHSYNGGVSKGSLVQMVSSRDSVIGEAVN